MKRSTSRAPSARFFESFGFKGHLMTAADFLVIGGGMAGMSAAAELSAKASVILLEAEDRIGFHATGRSAALFSEIYGNLPVRALTRASRDFLFNPPADFSGAPLTKPRGVLIVATPEQVDRLNAFVATPDLRSHLEDIDLATAHSFCPILRLDAVAAAAFESQARDIDVDALHQAYFKQFRRNGGDLRIAHRVDAVTREDGIWLVKAGDATFSAPVLINAAGAWADGIAALASVEKIGLQPMHRTAMLVDAPAGMNPATWPMILDIDEQFYIKPDAGLLLLSPADESPAEPGDAQPAEWDIAVAVDRASAVADLRVRTVRHSWAGLRSFVSDRTPVVGFDDRCPAFFWLVGQGGYGIQTAPAMARTAAALALHEPMPLDIAAHGINEAELSPRRFGRV
jgi:D-arginine dehydrogenase